MKNKRKNKKYSPKFKISCIIDMRNNHLPYRAIAKKYFGANSCAEENNYTYTIKRWERIFLEKGEAGLYIERRGRTRKMDNPNKGRPRKKVLDKQVKEDLIAENQ